MKIRMPEDFRGRFFVGQGGNQTWDHIHVLGEKGKIVIWKLLLLNRPIIVHLGTCVRFDPGHFIAPQCFCVLAWVSPCARVAIDMIWEAKTKPVHSQGPRSNSISFLVPVHSSAEVSGPIEKRLLASRAESMMRSSVSPVSERRSSLK